MKLTRPAAILMAAAMIYSGAASAAAGDAAKGKAVFARCLMCHTVQPDVNRLGPSLSGIVGKPAASVKGFTYSPALKAAKLRWTAENLEKYIANPRGFVPGTKMIFAGIPNATDRANLVAYLSNPGK